MFVENPAAFMQGGLTQTATWYGVPWAIDRTGASLDSSQVGPEGIQEQTAPVYFDLPDEDVGGHVQSRGYKITFPASQFVGIKRGDAVLIVTGAYAGSYSVRQAKTVDDGVFMEAMLQEL